MLSCFTNSTNIPRWENSEILSCSFAAVANENGAIKNFLHTFLLLLVKRRSGLQACRPGMRDTETGEAYSSDLSSVIYGRVLELQDDVLTRPYTKQYNVMPIAQMSSMDVCWSYKMMYLLDHTRSSTT